MTEPDPVSVAVEAALTPSVGDALCRESHDAPAGTSDWTVDPETGRSNSSPRFQSLAAEVEGILRRSGGLSLSPQWAASTARLILAQLAHQHGLQIGESGPAPSPDAEPAPLNLPAYAWGESVTWNNGRILVPLNRDDQTVADLVLDEDAAGTLAAMLDDAAGHKPPDCPRCFDRGYVPDWSRGLSAEHGEPGKKPCPDCQGDAVARETAEQTPPGGTIDQ